jgi:hypothetical protein
MKNLLTPSRTLAATLLLGLGPYAAAQSLGMPKVEAFIGRPLELTVPARFSDEPGDECVHADVLYGDQRVSADLVRATVLGTGAQRRVRIEASAPVDEPVVTVALRAGCRNTVSRNYTLLPEMQSPQVYAGAAPAATPSLALASGPTMLASLATQAAGAPRARPLALRPVLPADAAQSPIARKVRASAARSHDIAPTGGARLRLDVWEPSPQAMLRVSAQLSEPGDANARATAALLWQALNADPADLLRTSAMLQKLEGELSQLRQANGQTRTELVALRQRLDSRQQGLFSQQTAQVLTGLLLLAAAAGAFLWYRNARADRLARWYAPEADSSHDSLQPQQATQPPAQPALRQAPAVAEPPRAQPAPVKPAMPVATPFAVVPPSVVDRAPPVAAPPPGTIDFDLHPDEARAARPAPAARPAATMLRVETLAATFEEVEFLTSLGLWSDAMDVLKTYLADSSAPAPLAFFELMRLCVHTDDAPALAAARRRYQEVFHLEPPRFEHINAPLGLESYTDLASRITTGWGRPEVLDVIEEQLFDVPQAGRALSLQAGRDLICLHDVAMALMRESKLAQAGAEAEHALAPWALDDPDQARAAAQDAADVSGGNRFALDLDLSAQAAAPAAQELRESDAALAEAEEAALREAAAARVVEEEDAFSAAMAFESRPAAARRL